MAVFKDETEVYKYIGGIFEEALADPEIGTKFAESGVILKVTHTEPDTIFTVDMPSKKVLYGDDARNGPKPVVEMFMKADVAHQFWLGNVNISLALAKGQMRAKGPVPKILKLVPLAKSLFPRYKASLEQSGRSDLLEA
ncbi:MAG: sterol carrier protein [Acidimicrobiia bacterium]